MDITSVTLSNDASGRLSFAVTVPSHSTLPSRKGVGIWFDTDRNPNTGSGGAEYRIFVEPSGETGFHRWDAGQRSWLRFDEPVFSPYYQRGIWAGGVRLKGLGGASVFNIFAQTFDRTAGGGSVVNDRAPNSGSWTFQVKTGQPNQPKRKLFIAGLERRPNPPVAGQSFTIDVTVWRLPVGSGQFNGRVDCGATIGAKSVRFLGASVLPDRATCAWDIPVSAQGKTIAVLLVVTEGAATATKEFKARVAPPTATISIDEKKTVPRRGPEAGEIFYYGMKIGIVTASGAKRRVTMGEVSCKATISGKALEVIRAEVVPEDAAVQCGWNHLPRNATGKTMIVSLVLRSERPVRLTFTHNRKFVVR